MDGKKWQYYNLFAPCTNPIHRSIERRDADADASLRRVFAKVSRVVSKNGDDAWRRMRRRQQSAKDETDTN